MLSLYSFTVVALSAVSLFSAAQAANVNKRQDASQSCQSVCGLFSSSLQSNCGAFVPGITAIISGGGVPDINNQQVQQALACFCNNELVKEFTDCLSCNPNAFGPLPPNGLQLISQGCNALGRPVSVSSLPTAASASAAASDASSSDATAGTTSAAATTSNQATPAQPASTSASSSSSVPTTTQSVTKNGASSTSSTSAVVIAVLSVAGLVMATF